MLRIIAFILLLTPAFAAPVQILGGDSIGPDPNFTDNTGGFSAVQDGPNNIGHPAVLVSLTGREILTEFRMIGFGVPSSPSLGSLRFDNFAYQLDFWRLPDYLAGDAPAFSVNPIPSFMLDVEISTGYIVPVPSFGNSGVGGNNADTYDFVFDLTSFPALSSPLVAGDWVIGIQSHHVIADSGGLRTSGSTSLEGLIPYFSRDSIPRGILGDQDPSNVSVHWGINVSGRVFFPGDFNQDGAVDGQDFAIWEDRYGIDAGGDADGDGDTDGADFLIWQQNNGHSETVALSVIVAVGLPSCLLIGAMLWRKKKRKKKKKKT